eukprot:8366094-Pyramimonas_sp.AAC.2
MFGFAPTQRGNLQLTTASHMNPKVHLALQFLSRNYFRLENVIAVRLAKSVDKLPACAPATGSTLIYYDNDVTPAFHYYESTGTAIDVHRVTGSSHARIIQCLTSTKIGGFVNLGLSRRLHHHWTQRRTAQRAAAYRPSRRRRRHT